jgi:hypothetical protein
MTDMRKYAIAAAITAVAAGAVIATTVLPGAATSGIAQKGTGVPSPVPSVTVPAGVPTTVPPNATPPALTLAVATSGRYGPILTTPAGITVYRPVGRASGKGYSPLTVPPGTHLQLPILVSGKIGTTTSHQVTFNGMPLYTFSGDHVQGDTNGAGAHWRVIQTNP